MKGKPDVSSFLEGAAVETSGTSRKAADTKPKVTKHQKLLELPGPVYLALKDRAYEEFKKTGTRVTETQIIIDALRAHLGVSE